MNEVIYQTVPDEPPMPGTLDDFISTEDLAAFFKVKPKTVSAWRYEEPPLPSIKFKNRHYFSKRQVAWWLAKMQQLPDQTRLLVRSARQRMRGEA